MPSVHFRLNGVETAVEADPDRSLLDLLRGPLGMMGTHFGCGAGECGACNVLVDGQAVASCDAPLGTSEHPHPLQTAFIAEQALQCGYCIPGILISAAALLKRNPNPSDENVRAALDRNLCRCGSHNRIVKAVLRAAADMAAR
jgi:nicotinate dehydrogenase subunit A